MLREGEERGLKRYRGSRPALLDSETNNIFGLLFAFANPPSHLPQFYIVTDSKPQKFWHVLNSAVLAMGFTDLFSKFKLPTPLMLFLGNLCDLISWLTGRKLKLNAFAVRMLVIHRYFDITNARRDLGYEPLFTFEEGWGVTMDWFRVNWLPEFRGGGGRRMGRMIRGEGNDMNN